MCETNQTNSFVIFLGKNDDNTLHSFEKDVVNNLSPQCKEDFQDRSPFPDVLKISVNNNCDVWYIIGDVKPTLLLKELISQTKIILFVFDLSKPETLDFLKNGWGPIIKRVDENKPEDQERILYGTNSGSSEYSDELNKEIKSTMEMLYCEKYSGKESDKIKLIKSNEIKIEIIPDLIKYLKNKIPKPIDQPKGQIFDMISTDSIPTDDNKSEGDYSNEDENIQNVINVDNKIEKRKSKNNIEYKFNKIEHTAEIFNAKSITGDAFISPAVKLGNTCYIAIKICDFAFKESGIKTLSFSRDSKVKIIGDYAFQKSKLQRISIPNSLEKLSKYWCAGADELSEISVDQNNPYFHIDNCNFLIYEKDPIREILFSPREIQPKFKIPFNIGSYAFYKRKGLKKLTSESSCGELELGDYSFFGAENLETIKIKSDSINIGDYSFASSIKLESVEFSIRDKFKLGEHVFENCKKLSTISILTTKENGSDKEIPMIISHNTFEGCESLNEITISTKSGIILEKEVFTNKPKLESVSISGKEIILRDKCFSNSFKKDKDRLLIKAITIKSTSIVDIGHECFSGSYFETIDIECEELTIQRESFSKCSEMTEINISKASIININELSFDNCNNLQTISLNEIGFIYIKSPAFQGCKNFNNFEIKLSAKFIYNKYFQIKEQQSFTTNRFLIIENKRTGEIFPGEHLNENNELPNYLSQMISQSKINNPTISKSFGFCILNNGAKTNLILLNECFNNGTLFDMIKNRKLTNQQKYSIFVGIALGMEYVHSKNIPHENLTPTKILIDDEFHPHLNIFGLNDNSKPTPYDPPEIKKGLLRSQSTDVYSYSIIIYELMTGNIPYISVNNDFYLIKNQQLQNLMKRSLSYNSSEQPTFEEITQEILNEHFASTFNIDEQELLKYLNLFGLREFIQPKDEHKKQISNKEIKSTNMTNGYIEVNVNESNHINENSNISNKPSFVGQKEIFDSMTNCKCKLIAENKTAELINVQKITDKYSIPAFIINQNIRYEITKICDYAFKESKIQALSFSPDSKVKIIGDYAFQESKIQQIFIPKSLEKLSKYWCAGADELSQVFVDSDNHYFSYDNGFLIYEKKPIYEILFSPREIQGQFNIFCNIGSYAFCKRKGLKKLSSQPSCSNLEFGDHSFFGAENLEKINIRSDSIDIGDYSFANSYSLASAKFSFNTKFKLGEHSFENCKKLSDISISTTNENENQTPIIISSNTFKGCESISEIAISTKSKIILEKEIFANQQKLETISISGKEIILQEKCFANSFTKYTFNYNPYYKHIDIYKTVTLKSTSKVEIDQKCFSGSNLEMIDIECDELIIQKESFSGCSQFSKINISKATTINIDELSFQNCNSLKSISLNASKIINIGSNSFSGCSKLQNFTINSQLNNNQLSKLNIPKSSTTYNDKLSSFSIIRSQTTRINKEAFSGCNILNKINLESTKLELFDNCFSKMNKLEIIELKTKDISLFNQHIFNNIKSLSTIIIESESETPITINKSFFNGCESLSNITIQAKSTITLEEGILKEQQKVETIIISGKEIILLDKCFYKEPNRYYEVSNKTITIKSNSAVEIGQECFCESNFGTINIECEELIIQSRSFSECSQLSEINISKSSTINIDEFSFNNCANLKSISLDATKLVYIGSNSFSNCSNLQSFTVKSIKNSQQPAFSTNSIKELVIKSSCFNNCNKLSSISIGIAETAKINTNSFLNCNLINKINFTANNLELICDFFSGMNQIISSAIYNSKSLSSISIRNENEKPLKVSTNILKELPTLNEIFIINNSDIILENAPISTPNKNQRNSNSIDKFQKQFNQKNIKIESQTKVELLKKCFNEYPLKTIEIVCNEITIQRESFSNCSELTELKISEASTIIFDEYSFNNCTNLKTISLKEIGFIYIKSTAFQECNNFNKFDFKLSAKFDYQKYFKVEEKDPNDATYIIEKNITHEKYLTKITDDQTKQKEYLNRMLLVNKSNKPSIYNSFGIGILNSKKNRYLTTITEYFNNGSLSDMINTNKLTNQQKYFILVGIALGMEYVHSNKIQHESLTPTKILIDDEFHPHLNIFGPNDNSKLTPYDPPEIKKGLLRSQSTDVYSYSIIIYELMIGYKSYDSKLTSYDIYFIKNQALQNLLKRSLSNDPSKRPTFNEISQEMLSQQFASTFNINKQEILRYLNLFGLTELIRPENKHAQTESIMTAYKHEKIDINKPSEPNHQIDNNNDNNEPIIDEQKEIQYQLIAENKTADIINIQKVTDEYTIPEFIIELNKKYKITKINNYALKESKIKALSFSPDSKVKIIGDYAFQKSKIQRISIPRSLEKLSKYWCAGADELSEISVDQNNPYFYIKNGFLFYKKELINEVLYSPRENQTKFSIFCNIGSYAFYKRKGLQILSSKIYCDELELGDYSFFGTENLEKIKIESNSISIGDYCFASSNELISAEFTIEHGFKLGEHVFENCKKLTTISISITNEKEPPIIISHDTFKGCESLTNIKFQTKSTIIFDEGIFTNQRKLETIFISGNEIIISDKCFTNSFTKERNEYHEFIKTIIIKSTSKVDIGQQCFSGSNFESIDIECNLLSIQTGSFSNCSQLSEINISKTSIINIDENTFNKCINLISISLDATKLIKINTNSFLNCNLLKNINFTTIKLELIGNFNSKMNQIISKVIHNSKSLSTLSIQNENDKILKVSTNILKEIPTLNEIIIFNNSDIILSNELISTSNKKQHNSNDANIQNQKIIKIISKSKIELGKKCFVEFPLETIEIDCEEITIQAESFSNCSELTEINISNAFMININELSFNDCTNFKTISLNEIGFIYIKSTAFQGCKNLNNFDIKLSTKFDFQKYFIINETQQTDTASQQFYIVSKQTHEKFISEYLKSTENPNEYLSRMILLSKINNSVISNSFGIYFSKNINSKPYFATISEYFKNGSLYDVIKNNKLLKSKKYNIIVGITLGMEYVHLNNIPHEKLAPAKIMIDDEFHPHLNIFRVIKKRENNIHDSSPSLESDIYSYSMILYDLMTGKHVSLKPEENSNPDIKSIKNQSIQNLLQRCWQDNSKDIPSFGEITQVIMTRQCMDIFESKEEDTFKYLKSLGIIDITEKYYKQNDHNSKEIIKKPTTYENIQVQKNTEEANNKNESNNQNERFNKNELNKSQNSIEDNEKQRFKFKNNILIDISTKNQEAELVSMPKIKGDFCLQTTVSVKKQDYYITKICDCTFKESEIISLSFLSDSKMKIIGDYAFQGSTIQRISIPKSLEKLSKYWCAGADELSQISVERGNPYFYINDDNFLIYKKDTFHEILFSPRKIQKKLIVSSNIGSYSFYKRNGLQNIEISDSTLNIIEIGDYSFFGAENLCSLNFNINEMKIGDFCFGESHKLGNIFLHVGKLTIGNGCFMNCFFLKNIFFNNLRDINIGKNAFQGCKSLDKLIIKNTINLELCDHCFSGMENIKSIELSSRNCFNIGKYIFNVCINLSTITIQYEGKRNLIIQANTFCGCESLIDIRITLISSLILEDEVFSQQHKLMQINIEANEIIIGNKCFKNSFDASSTNKKKYIKLLSELKVDIGKQCFYESNLNSVEIRGQQIIIQTESFSNCSLLTKLNISDASNLIINELAFKNCSEFISIALNKVGYVLIQSSVFYNCNKFTGFNINNPLASNIFDYFDIENQDLKENKFYIKGTDEKLLAHYFSKHDFSQYLMKMVLLSKEHNPTISNYFGFGLFTYNFRTMNNYYNIILTKLYNKSSLNEIIQNNKLTNPQKYFILIGITLGMEYIHSNNIPHENLTPAKIMIDDKFHPHLNIFENIDNSELTVYDPPELFERKQYSSKSDIYSFSMISYELLSGNQLLAHKNDDEKRNIINQLIHGVRPKIRHINNEYVVNMIQKCWSKNPSERPSFNEIFQIMTNDNFINYFIIPEASLYEYLELFGITELNEIIEYDNINYRIFKRNQIAEIVGLNQKTRKSFIYKNIKYNNKKYNITRICDHSFYKSPIKSFDFSNESKLIKIGNFAFAESSLSEISFPASLEYIGDYGFCKLKDIQNINFSGQRLSLGKGCFENCISLKSVKFSIQGDIILGTDSFKGCKQLQDVSFGISSLNDNFNNQNVKIGSNCFESCESLKSFNCTSSIIVFNSNVFKKCRKLEKFSVKGYIKSSDCEEDKPLFEGSFFDDCKSLKEILINSKGNIKILSDNIKSCSNLTTVKLTSLSSIILLKQGYYNSSIKSFEADGLEVKVCDSFFSQSSYLESVHIKTEKLTIENRCFNSCNKLLSITLENLKEATFGPNAFSECQYLSHINFISSTTKLNIINNLAIGQYCFNNCLNLLPISFGNITNANIEESAFSGCQRFIRFNLNVSSKLEIGDFCFSSEVNLKTVNINADELYIGRNIFSKCYNIASASFCYKKNSNIDKNTFSGLPKNCKLIINDKSITKYF